MMALIPLAADLSYFRNHRHDLLPIWRVTTYLAKWNNVWKHRGVYATCAWIFDLPFHVPQRLGYLDHGLLWLGFTSSSSTLGCPLAERVVDSTIHTFGVSQGDPRRGDAFIYMVHPHATPFPALQWRSLVAWYFSPVLDAFRFWILPHLHFFKKAFLNFTQVECSFLHPWSDE